MSERRVWVDSVSYERVRDLTLLSGTGVLLAAELGDNEDLRVTVGAGAAGAGTLASEITVDSTDIPGAETVLQELLEDAANGELGQVTIKEVTFTETAGAGTYTGTVSLPDGCIITFVAWRTSAAWDADTTVLDLGITGALTTWGSDIDVDGAAGDTLIPDPTATAPTVITTQDFIATLVTTGTGGTTGRTKVWVGYAIPQTQAAIKA